LIIGNNDVVLVCPINFRSTEPITSSIIHLTIL
jgi:hypothetical protein